MNELPHDAARPAARRDCFGALASVRRPARGVHDAISMKDFTPRVYPRPSPGTRLGPDHPATRAALGRMLEASQAMVPQFDATTPEAVAWRRACGAWGYMNRAHRRHLAAQV